MAHTNDDERRRRANADLLAVCRQTVAGLLGIIAHLADIDGSEAVVKITARLADNLNAAIAKAESYDGP